MIKKRKILFYEKNLPVIYPFYFNQTSWDWNLSSLAPTRNEIKYNLLLESQLREI